MDSQPEINDRMRIILVDWLIDVHTKFDLSLKTLYQKINIIDRFLAVKAVPRRELQLVDDFVCISDSAFTHEQILVMEKIILGKLEWTLIMPTPYVFLVCFIKASVLDQELLVSFHSTIGGEKLKVLYRKYSDPHRGAVTVLLLA
ncbi:putative cyclin [Lupinus albus]|uniref:B-like cyclin n=1 Tax=Lupinus albus TaxID=3870 RepID=A0A6A4NFM1_LUPAL|nr:putative cyclin [Lupinus albus]